MNPLLIAGLASGLSAVANAGESLFNKATGNLTSKLGKTGEVLESVGSDFAKHLSAQQKGHLEQGKLDRPLNLQEHLKSEGIFNQDMLEAHTFHRSEHFLGHADLAEWFDSVPEGTDIKLGYEEQGRITLLADNGQFCHLDLETPIGKEAARLFELKQLGDFSGMHAGTHLNELASQLPEKPQGIYHSLS